MSKLTLNEGSDIDLLLSEMISLKKVRNDNTIEVGMLQKKFLPNKTSYYVTNIVYKILDHEPKVIITDKKMGIRTVVWSTPLLESFLLGGGFSKIAEEIAITEKYKKELEELNLAKIKYDVKNSKRIYKTYWWTFGFSVIALLISLTLLYFKIREK